MRTHGKSRDGEVWQRHPTFTDYEVSNLGRLRKHTSYTHYVATHGGRAVIYGKRTHKVKVASLVAEVFLGKCPEGHHLAFRDRNKNNTELDNLYYKVGSTKGRPHGSRKGD